MEEGRTGVICPGIHLIYCVAGERKVTLNLDAIVTRSDYNTEDTMCPACLPLHVPRSQ